MNKEKYRKLSKDFFEKLLSIDCSTDDLADFSKENNINDLCNYSIFLYAEERKRLKSDVNLTSWFVFNNNNNDLFSNKINFVKDYYFELYYYLDMFTNQIYLSGFPNNEELQRLDRRSVELTTKQRELENQQESITIEIERQNKKLNEQKKIIKDQQDDFQNTANKLNSIYSEFITILGIFTAITFAIFGGINTINSISSNLHISSSNPQNLGNLLIAAAVLGIVLFGIITVLFAGMAKITEKDYNLSPLLTISVLAIISAMFMIGLVFTFLADNWNLSIWPQIIISVVVIAAVIIAVAIFTKCKSNKFKKS